MRWTSRILWGARWEGADNIPPSGPCILAASHESFLDPLLLGAATRPVHYLARKTLFFKDGRPVKVRLWCARVCHILLLDREGVGSAAIRLALEALADGGVVVLFPEGTRSRDGTLGEFRAGVGLIALRSGAPVVPVSVRGTGDVWGPGQSRPNLRRGRIRIRFGKTIRYTRPTKARDVAADLRGRVLDLRETTRTDRPGDGGAPHEIADGSSSKGGTVGTIPSRENAGGDPG